VLGFAVGGLIIALTTTAGFESFELVWLGTFGSALGINQLIQLTGPLLLAGCSAAVASKANLWNVGIEGQLIFGAWAATAVAFAFPSLPGPLLIPLMLLAAMLGGALTMLLPALGRAYWRVDEIVSTLMLNFVAASWLTYWVTGPWRDSGSSTGTALGARKVSENAMTPTIQLGSYQIDFALLLGLACAISLWLFFRYSGFGYRVKLVGADPRAARYAGVNVARVQVAVLLISGAVGGLPGIVVELGGIGRFGPEISNYTGYIGLLVAALAGAAFLECVPMAAIVALIAATGGALQIAGVPGDIVFLLTGTVFLVGALCDVISRVRFRGGLAGRVGSLGPETAPLGLEEGRDEL
jgi:simple sugar transport system permease protein